MIWGLSLRVCTRSTQGTVVCTHRDTKAAWVSSPWSSSAGSPQPHFHTMGWVSARSGFLEGCLPSTDPRPPHPSITVGRDLRPGPARRATAPEFLSETLAWYFPPVCSAWSTYHALTVCTVAGVWSRPFPTLNPSRRWHVMSTCDSEPIRSLDQAEADAGGGGHVEGGMASAWG